MIKSYRITIPPKGLAHLDDETLAGRLHTYLANAGFEVEGVSVEHHVINGTVEGSMYLKGPFVRIECNKDPTTSLIAFTWEKPADEDLETIKRFLASGDHFIEMTPEDQDRIMKAMAGVFLSRFG